MRAVSLSLRAMMAGAVGFLVGLAFGVVVGAIASGFLGILEIPAEQGPMQLLIILLIGIFIGGSLTALALSTDVLPISKRSHQVQLCLGNSIIAMIIALVIHESSGIQWLNQIDPLLLQQQLIDQGFMAANIESVLNSLLWMTFVGNVTFWTAALIAAGLAIAGTVYTYFADRATKQEQTRQDQFSEFYRSRRTK